MYIFRILHRNRAQNITQYHDNNIWKHICIKQLSYSTETYLRYNAESKKVVRKIHVISTSWIGPIPTKYELFLLCTRELYLRENIWMYHVPSRFALKVLVLYSTHEPTSSNIYWYDARRYSAACITQIRNSFYTGVRAKIALLDTYIPEVFQILFYQ